MTSDATQISDGSVRDGAKARAQDVPPEYKRTKVGVIPADWEVKLLSEHFRIYAGGDVPKNSLSQTRSASHPYPVFANALQNHGLYGFTNERRSRKGSLTITARGFLGHAEYRDEPFFPIVRLLVLEPVGQLDARFATYAINDRVKFAFESTGVPQLTAPQVGKYSIASPQLPEQRAIAGALSDVDGLLGALEALIAKKRAIKQAAMQQLLTGKTRLPGFSGEWEPKRLGDISELQRQTVVPAAIGGELFTHFSLPAFDDGQIPVTELGSAIGSNKFRVPDGAVLVSKLNPRIPRVWMPHGEVPNAVASTEFLVLTPRQGTSRVFLFVLCSSPEFCERLELSATGTTGSHQRVNPSDAMKISLRVPPEADEQSAIASVLSDIDAEITALEACRDKTRQIKHGMMQQLLTGRVRLVKPEAAA